MRNGLWSLFCAVVSAVVLSVVSAGPALAAESCPNETLRGGPSAALPDCRAYEQVSPAEKHGYDATGRGAGAEQHMPAQAAASGEGAVAYLGAGGFNGAQSSALPVAHLSTRTPSGWKTTELTPPQNAAIEGEGVRFSYDFSENLLETAVKMPFLRPGAGGEPENVDNLYVREPGNNYRWINVGTPPSGCTSRETECFEKTALVSFAGATPDFSRTLFEDSASIASNGAEPAPEGSYIVNLYENNGGAVHVVGVLPDGKLSPTGAWAGNNDTYLGVAAYFDAWFTLYADKGFQTQQDQGAMEHDISANGRRVIFESVADGGEPDAAQNGQIEVYDRVEGKKTIELSAPAAGASPKVTTAEPAQFWAASANGSRVYFTSSAELTSESNTGEANNSEDLYEYSFEREEHGEQPLRDLTVDTAAADEATGAGVLGVLGEGESEEAGKPSSYVYFAAKGELVSGHGTDGEANLYVSHDGGAPTFIATLRPAFTREGGGGGSVDAEGDFRDWAVKPAESQAYVTPDGKYLAFMSINSLHTTNFPSGYNNVDTTSGLADSEVYEYSAEAGTLSCASCEPSGVPPWGGVATPEQGYFFGAFLGQANPNRSSATVFHRPRSVSDNGARVFFSAPPMASEREADTNNAKVFEWERGGEGSCELASGCVFRLSSAASPGPASFLDADAAGNNVFFSTASQLVAGDKDNLVDVYDARVNGGFATTAEPAVCVTHCRSEGATQPGAIGLVSGITGPSGNLPPAPSAPTQAASKQAKRKLSKQTRARRQLARCRQRARKHRKGAQRRHALRRCNARYRGAAARRHRRKRGRRARKNAALKHRTHQVRRGQ